MGSFEELRKKQIELLSSVLNKSKIQARVNGCGCSDLKICEDEIKIDNAVIGYIRPKEVWSNSCDLDFYNGNMYLITVDITVEKDLNGEKLRIWINNGTFQIVDMNDFDEIEYTENMLENWGKEDLYNLLERYDCSPSELAERYLNDLGLEETIGDIYFQDIRNNRYGIKWSSLRGIDSIMEDLTEKQQAFLFDNALGIIKELENFYNRDLTDDDIYNIGVLINKMFRNNYEGNNIIECILDECDLLED